MGSSAASAECLRAIMREEGLDVVGVITQPDRQVGRGRDRQKMTPCPCAAYAQSRGIIDIIKPENVNEGWVLSRIAAWDPDVIAVVAYGQILRKPILAFPKHGCINCHFSLLPKYRGAAPVIAALLAGDRMTGVTVMRMGEGLDDGPIMLQSYEPIYPDTTGGALMDDLAVAGGVTLAKALKMLDRGMLPPEVPQDPKFATHVKKLHKTDGLINWDLPVLEIERRIRAYCPWPGSYTFLPERFRKKGMLGRVVITRARFHRLEENWRDVPVGTVLKLDKEGPVVKCHDTALLLTELKPEGSSLMDGGSFLRGRQLKPFEDRFLDQ